MLFNLGFAVKTTVGIINKMWEGGRGEWSFMNYYSLSSQIWDDLPCNSNHFHLASQGSKELVNITSWPCVSFSQLHFQLRAEEKQETSVRSVKKQEDGWEVGWCMKSVIGEGQRWLTLCWRRRYCAASIASNACRSRKVPTCGKKGLSELLFLFLIHTGSLRRLTVHTLPPKGALTPPTHCSSTCRRTGLHC